VDVYDITEAERIIAIIRSNFLDIRDIWLDYDNLRVVVLAYDGLEYEMSIEEFVFEHTPRH
jgi:hypothetical protein